MTVKPTVHMLQTIGNVIPRAFSTSGGEGGGRYLSLNSQYRLFRDTQREN